MPAVARLFQWVTQNLGFTSASADASRGAASSASSPTSRGAVSLDVYQGKALADSRALRGLLDDGGLRKFAACRVSGACAVAADLGAHPERYRVISGRPVKLGHGAVIEGSVQHGGLQPHYVVDLGHLELRDLLAAAESIKKEKLPTFEAARRVIEVVSRSLANKAYRSQPYLQLLQATRSAGKNVSLGEYLSFEAGVCREHGLLTHLALEAAGLDSSYVYLSATQGTRVEDHGVALFRDGRTLFIADAYNTNYNGLRLKDVLRSGGSRAEDPKAPFAAPGMLGCSAKLVPYPRYFVPS